MVWSWTRSSPPQPQSSRLCACLLSTLPVRTGGKAWPKQAALGPNSLEPRIFSICSEGKVPLLPALASPVASPSLLRGGGDRLLHRLCPVGAWLYVRKEHEGSGKPRPPSQTLAAVPS